MQMYNGGRIFELSINDEGMIERKDWIRDMYGEKIVQIDAEEIK